MTKVIIALLLAFNITIAFGAVVSGSSCHKSIGKFNEKVTKLVSNAKTQTTEWGIYSDIQSLKGLSFALKYTCMNETLEVVTTDTTQTAAELKACDKLREIVQSFLPEKGDSGYKGGDDKSTELNKEILGAGKNLGENCTISLVAKDEEEEEVEEESELGEFVLNPIEEESLDEEDDLAVEEEEEDVEEDSIYAKYINKYKPKNIEKEYKNEANEEENAEEEKLDSDLVALNLINVNKKGKNDSGSQWTEGGYENYTNSSQWQSGGYEKYYDQNKTGSQLLFMKFY